MGAASSSKKSRNDSHKGTKPTRKTSFRSMRFRRHKQKESGPPPKLYVSNANASCRMVWLYCLEHGVPVEVQFLEDRRGITTTNEFRDLNPFHTVPVLKDGDTVLFESVAILHYLAQEYSNFAGFGADAASRAKAGSMVCWASKNLLKAVGYHYVFPQCVDEYKLRSEEANQALIEHGLNEVRSILDTLQSDYLTRNQYLLGSECTVADLCVAVVLTLLDSTTFDWDPWPKVSAWMERMKERGKWSQVNEAHQKCVEASDRSDRSAGRGRRMRPVVSMMLVDMDEDEVEGEQEALTSKEGANDTRVQVHFEDGKAEGVLEDKAGKEESNTQTPDQAESEQRAEAKESKDERVDEAAKEEEEAESTQGDKTGAPANETPEEEPKLAVEEVAPQEEAKPDAEVEGGVKAEAPGEEESEEKQAETGDEPEVAPQEEAKPDAEVEGGLKPEASGEEESEEKLVETGDEPSLPKSEDDMTDAQTVGDVSESAVTEQKSTSVEGEQNEEVEAVEVEQDAGDVAKSSVAAEEEATNKEEDVANKPGVEEVEAEVKEEDKEQEEQQEEKEEEPDDIVTEGEKVEDGTGDEPKEEEVGQAEQSEVQDDQQVPEVGELKEVDGAVDGNSSSPVGLRVTEQPAEEEGLVENPPENEPAAEETKQEEEN